MERVKGIEPSSQPWEGHILPLNHTRRDAANFLAERKSQGNSKYKINMKTRDAASPKGGMNFGPETASGILDAAVMPA